MIIFNHAAHIELWDWLSKNPDKEKIDWPGWDIHGGAFNYKRTMNSCFACETAQEIYRDRTDEDGNMCMFCPLIWSDKQQFYCCDYISELYGLWMEFKHYNDLRIKFAQQIRDLPLKENVLKEVHNYGSI